LLDKDNQWHPLVDKKGKAIDGQATFRMRHFMGNNAYWFFAFFWLTKGPRNTN
jgi:CRISPR/Cas system Type II protein with McrA/HNH and RuvC-like nuclease domain